MIIYSTYKSKSLLPMVTRKGEKKSFYSRNKEFVDSLIYGSIFISAIVAVLYIISK